MPFIGGSWWKREGNKIRGTFRGTKGVKKTPALHSLSYSPLHRSLSFHPSPLRPLFPCVVLLIFGQFLHSWGWDWNGNEELGWVSEVSEPRQWPRPNKEGAPARHSTPPLRRHVSETEGTRAATIQPLIPPDYQPLTSITASGKQCIKRPQQGRWKITDSAGVEREEGGR